MLARLVKMGSAAGPISAALLLLAAVWLASAAYARSGHGFNSDDLTMIDFTDDLLAGADLRGWHLPGAPYFFPDVVLLILCRLIFNDLAQLFLVYSVLFYSATALSLTWLGREAGLRWRTAWSAACLGAALLLALHLRPGYEGRMAALPHPTSHVGVLPVGFGLLAFLLASVRRGFRLADGAVCVCLGGLALFSDRLLLSQILAPLAAALVLLWWLKNITPRRLLMASLLLVLMVITAQAWRSLFVRSGLTLLGIGSYFALPNDAQLWAHAVVVWQVWKSQHLQLMLTGLFVLVAGLGARPAWRALRGGNGTALGVTVFAVLSMLSGLAVPLLFMGNMAAVPEFERYFYSLTLLPILMVGLVAQVALADHRPRLACLCQVALAGTVVWLLAGEFRVHGVAAMRQPYPPLAQALDQLARERGCRFGLAGYWESRYLRFLTREHVVLVPTAWDGSPSIHGHTPDAWLDPDRDSLALPTYRLVILGNPPSVGADAVRAEFGEPSEKRVAGSEIWIYDRLESPRFQMFLNSLLARRYERLAAPRQPQQPPLLAKAKDGFRQATVWKGAVVAGRGHDVEVRFDAPVRGQLLDVGADPTADFSVVFYRAATRVGQVEVPRITWQGSPPDYGVATWRSRLVPLPAAVAGHEWDRAVVRYPGPKEGAALGHFLVFAADGANRLAEAPAPRRFEAELLSAPACPAAVPVADTAASGGRAQLADPFAPLCLVYGPGTRVPPGRYQVAFALKSDGAGSPGTIATLEVMATLPGETAPRALGTRTVDGQEFEHPDRYQVFRLTFVTEVTLDPALFRVSCHGRGRVWADYIDLVPLAE